MLQAAGTPHRELTGGTAIGKNDLKSFVDSHMPVIKPLRRGNWALTVFGMVNHEVQIHASKNRVAWSHVATSA